MAFENEINQLTTSIWESMLHLTVEPENAPLPEGQRTIQAVVQITGAWRGAVTLSCGAPLASTAAGIMFGVGDADASTADMQDAVGELANMIGGNVKGLLPEACHLSLPSVVEGSDYTVRVPGSRLVTRVPLRCGKHPLNVSLLESEDQNIAA